MTTETPTPEDGTPEKATRILTYIGRRIQKGRLFHCFVDYTDEAIVWFPKVKASLFAGAVIGTTYDLSEGIPAIWRDRATGQAESQTRLDWQARDRAEYQKSQEKKTSSSPDLDAAVEAIQKARRKMPANQLALFDAWLLNKIR